jgi:hypothetical protein
LADFGVEQQGLPDALLFALRLSARLTDAFNAPILPPTTYVLPFEETGIPPVKIKLPNIIYKVEII